MLLSALLADEHVQALINSGHVIKQNEGESMPKGITYLPSNTKRAKQIMQAKGSRTIQGESRTLTDKQIEQMEHNKRIEEQKAIKKANKEQGRKY